MAIVRQDKRPQAIQLLQEARTQLDGLLRQADAMQATLESLELDLGLASEKQQAERAQCMVMHYPQGAEVGHTLDECTEDCAASELIEELEGDGNEETSENETPGG
jgi:hypothetical protein